MVPAANEDVLMFTSNFKSAWRHPKAVNIARFPPRNWVGRHYFSLAPEPWMLKIKDLAVYDQVFKDQILAKLDPKRVYEELGEDAVLLCYEIPGEYCHRRVVAEWLENSLGIQVPELVVPRTLEMFGPENS
jgi:hypothetical protein